MARLSGPTRLAPRLDLNDLLDAPAAPAAPAVSGGANDLLDLLGGGPAAPAPVAMAGDGLLDILGMPPAAQEAPPMVAYEKNGLKITFYPRKVARQPLWWLKTKHA